MEQRQAWWWGALLTLTCISSPAAAQDSSTLDRAVVAFDEGEFERSRALLNEARGAAEVSRDELVRILTYEALTAQAVGEDAAADAAVLRLATLAPDAFGSRAPPTIRRRMERALEQSGGDRLGLEIEHRDQDGSLRIRARVRGDLGGLTERIELRTRVDGGPWSEPEGDRASLNGVTAEQVEVVARAFGVGGAVLASVGTPSDPMRLTAPLTEPEPEPIAPPAEDEGDDTALHVLLVVGAIVVVGAAVGIGAGVAASDSNGDGPIEFTGPPVVRW